MVAEADFVVSVTDVALIVTVFPVGIAAGAVYTVGDPLAVEVGAKLPHVLLPQETAQVTPAFALSPATFAVRLVAELMTTVAGGALAKETLMPAAALMVMVAEAVLVVSVTEVATTVTVLPVGTAAGAWKVVGDPLCVDVGLKLQHAWLPQVTDHVTPALLGSLPTVALIDVVPLTLKDDGAPASATVIGWVGLLPPPPPHAASARLRATVAVIKIVLKDFIAHL